MGNRYFTVALTAGLVMIAFGGTAFIVDATHNKNELIFSIILFSIMLPFAIWGLINLIKGRKDNG